MDFVHGCEREGLSNYEHERNEACSAELLASIQKHHGCIIEQIEPVIAEPAPRVRLKPVQPISLREAFQRAWQRLEAPVPTFGRVELIQRAVLTFYPFTMQDLKSVRRTAQVVRARQIAMYLVKEMTSRSLPEVGRKFGGRDHTTVLHAVRKIKGMVEQDAVFAAHITAIRNFIEGSNETDANSSDRLSPQEVAAASPNRASASACVA